MAVQIDSEIRRAGERKQNPFLVVVANNPVLDLTRTNGTIAADRMDDAAYRAAVDHLEKALWGKLPGQSEGAFGDQRLARRVRLEVLTIRDAPVTREWALVENWPAQGIIAPLPANIVNLVHRKLGRIADVVFVLSNSPTNKRASAYPGTDNRHRGFDRFEIRVNGTVERFRHHFWPSTPGTIAMHVSERSITAVHEFAHAISTANAKDGPEGEARNGQIVDLYNDAGRGLNKRASREPPWGYFVEYTGPTGEIVRHDWDRDRNPLGYPATWTSYHCARSRPQLPAVMDNYFQAPGGRQTACLHDTITRQFIRDRVAARMKRA